MSHFGSTEHRMEVAKGNIAGHTQQNIVMRSLFIDNTGFKDIWGVDGDLVYPTAAETWEVVSDNAADTSAGAGARQVVVTYLDDSYVEQTKIVSMNGTTPVTLNADHFRPRSVVVIDSDPAVGHNVGTITVRSTGGGTPTRNIIEATFSASQDTSYTVPAGRSAFFLKQSPYWPKNQDGEIKGFLGIFGTDTNITGGIFPAYQNTFDITFRAYLRTPEKTDIRFRAKSSSATDTDFSFVHEFMVIENTYLDQA